VKPNARRGIKLRRILRAHSKRVCRVAWSPTTEVLASSDRGGAIFIWDAKSDTYLHQLTGEGPSVHGVSWAPDGRRLAAVHADGLLTVWDTDLGQNVFSGYFGAQAQSLYSVAWAPNGQMIAIGTQGGNILLVDPLGHLLTSLIGIHAFVVMQLTWDREGRRLASVSRDGGLVILDLDGPTVIRQAENFAEGELNAVKWFPDGSKIILAGGEPKLVIRETTGVDSREAHIVEGHTLGIVDVCVSSKGSLFASKSHDGDVRIWRTDTRATVSIIKERMPDSLNAGLAFHPTKPILATLDETGMLVRIWDVFEGDLLKDPGISKWSETLSVKMLLVGESGAGKSCLATRLAERRAALPEERAATHGVRLIPMKAVDLFGGASPQAGTRRDFVLWDIGGHDEYRLVHQLFFDNSDLALVLFDATRGMPAYDDAEAWSKRLRRHASGASTKMILVGTKVDQTEQEDMLDKKRIDDLVVRCGFAGFVPVSADTDRNIGRLRSLIAENLDWTQLKTSDRPELFQGIYDCVEDKRMEGAIVLPVPDLRREVRDRWPDLYEEDALEAVIAELARQGLVARAGLASGEEVLVLQVGQVERYAGSLLASAKGTDYGVPALDLSAVVSPNIRLPRIPGRERLPRLEERFVLEGVVQLLLQRGICFSHEGLLVFPSLFPTSGDWVSPDLKSAGVVYYDFSGAVENVYASLIAKLAVGRSFGRARLWRWTAEFTDPEGGTCGIRIIDRGRGEAQMELQFSSSVSKSREALFARFVEEHLRRWGIPTFVQFELSCPNCRYLFHQGDVLRRVQSGVYRINCVDCGNAVTIPKEIGGTREIDGASRRDAFALHSQAGGEIEVTVQAAKDDFKKLDAGASRRGRTMVLHLSDLQFGTDVKPHAELGPLIAHLKDVDRGFGGDSIGCVVVSGDLTSRGSPAEFERVCQFLHGLVHELGISSNRFVLVPGNHDIPYDLEVYTSVSKRRADTSSLRPGSFSFQGECVLIRKPNAVYDQRFQNFDQYLYHPFTMSGYPLDPSKQGLTFLFEDMGIQFLALNSCCEIDEFFPNRSSMNRAAVQQAIANADGKLKKAGLNTGAVLRIATWHHPITGKQTEAPIEDTSFMGLLQQAKVRLCIHGHVHDAQTGIHHHEDPRGTYLAATGTCGAVAADRPESTPMVLSLIEVSPRFDFVRIHTSRRQTHGGSWEKWHNWNTADSDIALSYYTIELD